MAYDAFLKFAASEIKGDTQDPAFKDGMEIVSFSLGASNPVTIGSHSAGAGAGKVSISSFNFMKKTDSASPALFLACAQGAHFPKVEVTLRKAGKDALKYLVYTFETVFVESIQWSGSSGGDDTPTESVSLAFGKVTMSYTPQDKGGKGGSPIVQMWNQMTNTNK